MKILLVHNRYQQPGGEDVVFEQEAQLLRLKGHHVIEYIRSNKEILDFSFWEKSRIPKRVIWASDSIKQLRDLLRRERPAVAHFHNTFVMISPAAYYACKEFGVPVVQTLHNFRLLCPRADFFRNGHICEECLDKPIPWPGVMHRCYHHSALMTFGVASMLAFHRWKRTWSDCIDIYIALTEFGRNKFIEGGIPAHKIVVKPNFVYPDPEVKTIIGGGAIFAGRFSPEKRLMTLLSAWKRCPEKQLLLVGAGPESSNVEKLIREWNLSGVKAVGLLPRALLFDLMRKSSFLIFPSEWYEGFPLIIGEAFSLGIPVIAARIGAAKDIVADGRTGLHFEPGDPDDLFEKLQWAWSHPKDMEEMGKQARREYELKYTAERNYKMLIDIYRLAIERAKEPAGTGISKDAT